MKAFFYLLAGSVLFICSCKKAPVQDNVQGDATAEFSVTKLCNNNWLPNELQLIDSTLVLYNSSYKTGIIYESEVISYTWNFGDNTNSNATNPVHKYSKPGNYSIQLIVFLNGVSVDTATKHIRIIIGQKEFKTSMAYNDAIDIAETPGKGALVLVQSYNNVLNKSYSLIKVDSMLRQEWIKPLGGTNVRLNSIRQVNATEYIISGNLEAGNINQFSISKIDNLGNLIWTKYFAGLQGFNTFTIPSADGGFITGGTVLLAGSYLSAIVKLNAAGDETWRNILSGNAWYASPENILELNGGYVFASNSRTLNEKILLTLLNSSGAIIRQDSIARTSVSSPFSAGISYTNQTFMVYGIGTDMVYFLDNNFVLKSSKKIAGLQITSVQSGANIFYIAQTGGQGKDGGVNAITPNGMQYWDHGINDIIPISCSNTMMGATRRCKKVIHTSANEIIALSDGQNDPFGGPSSSTYVVKLEADGSVK